MIWKEYDSLSKRTDAKILIIIFGGWKKTLS